MKSNAKLLQIGEVSKRSRTSIHAIRFYEKEGLLDKPSRSQGGFRIYSGETVDRILFIKKAQELGLTLREIKKITCCGEKGLGPCCNMTVDLFSHKIKEFEGKIEELQQTKKKLKSVLGGWVGKKKK